MLIMLMKYIHYQVKSVFKVARYYFGGLIYPKFHHKLHHYKKRFGKIASTAVLDKDENLL